MESDAVAEIELAMKRPREENLIFKERKMLTLWKGNMVMTPRGLEIPPIVLFHRNLEEMSALASIRTVECQWLLEFEISFENSKLYGG